MEARQMKMWTEALKQRPGFGLQTKGMRIQPGICNHNPFLKKEDLSHLRPDCDCTLLALPCSLLKALRRSPFIPFDRSDPLLSCQYGPNTNALIQESLGSGEIPLSQMFYFHLRWTFNWNSLIEVLFFFLLFWSFYHITSFPSSSLTKKGKSLHSS